MSTTSSDLPHPIVPTHAIEIDGQTSELSLRPTGINIQHGYANKWLSEGPAGDLRSQICLGALGESLGIMKSVSRGFSMLYLLDADKEQSPDCGH